MTVSAALRALAAAGITATYMPADDEQCDDDIVLNLNSNICVQVSATRNGLEFTGKFYDGEGDDFGVTHGRGTTDPVAAAREALLLALA